MPYEISMCGGGPWGFRMGGGAFTGKPLTISRITPGGKAAQSNVMQGDVLTAVNGMGITDLQLPEVMQIIKESGEEVHLTLLTQEEASITIGQKRQSQANITTAAERERPLNPQSPLPPRFRVTPRSTPEPPKLNGVVPVSPLAAAPKPFIPCDRPQAKSPVPPSLSPAPAQVCLDPVSTSAPFVAIITPVSSPVASPNRSLHAASPSPTRSVSPNRQTIRELEAMPPKNKPQPPVPKPRKAAPVEEQAASIESKPTADNPEEDEHKFPDYVKRQLKPQKPLPTFKPQVSWLHDKLKINLKGNPNAMTDPGNKLKQAAQANPNKPISIEGPISGTVVHAQYNTPVGLYSGSQIVSTLVGTAAARGANVPDPETFGDNNTTVDTNTAVYKMIHKNARPCASPAQSRSIQILDQILSHPEAAQRYASKK